MPKTFFREERRWMIEKNQAWSRGLRLRCSIRHSETFGTTFKNAIGFETVDVKPDEYSDECLAHLSLDEAQQLMDGLYAAGVRPSEGQGSAGAMKATERHLEDMRSLVFQGMRIKKK